MLFPRRFTVAVLSVVVLAVTTACDGSDDPETTPSPSASVTESSSPAQPTPTETSAPAETPEQQAERLALAQVKAYYEVGDRLYGDPNEPLSVLDGYAQDQALAEFIDSVKERRARGERIELHTKVRSSWLGEEGVVFNKKSPRAVVDLYVCYDIGDAQVVDADGNRTPLVGPNVPRVAQARYAVYADQWPNDDPGAWRVGKEYAAGEACKQ